MQLTRAADYAVRVMIHLASLPSGTRLPLNMLAQAVNVPESFLSKVLQSLTRAGLVASRRGTDGGFTLAAGTNTASMLDVIQAIDGPIQLNVCLAHDGSCARSGNCPAHPVWLRAQEALVKVLAEARLSDMGTHAHSASLAAIN
jgi:Rrf2 family protein